MSPERAYHCTPDQMGRFCQIFMGLRVRWSSLRSTLRVWRDAIPGRVSRTGIGTSYAEYELPVASAAYGTETGLARPFRAYGF